MPTPVEGYFLNGTRIPSVTTILSNLGWNRDALVRWAYGQGMKGVDLYAKTEAQIGTLAHQLIEDSIHDRPSVIPEWATEDMLAKAYQAQSAFDEWREDSNIKIVGTELRMIHPGLRVGGTLDFLALRRGDRVLLPDLKTSNGTYEDHIIQVAAYALLLEGYLPLWDGGPCQVDSVAVLRCDKETGSFSHKQIPRRELEPAFNAFLRARALHDDRAAVKKLCR